MYSPRRAGSEPSSFAITLREESGRSLFTTVKLAFASKATGRKSLLTAAVLRAS